MNSTLFAIKEEYMGTVVGFNNSGLPLGQRNDLDKLALMAQHDKTIAQYFVNCPTLEQIKSYQAETFNEKIALASPEPVSQQEPSQPVAPATDTAASVNTVTEANTEK